MKKMIALCVALTLLLALGACSKDTKKTETTAATGESTTATAQSTATAEDSTAAASTTAAGKQEKFTPSKNEDGDFMIIMPPSFFDKENPPSAELTDAQKGAGFKKAIINDDGSLTYIIAADSYEAFKTQTLKERNDDFAALPARQPFIKKVVANEDYSVVNVQADAALYSQNQINNMAAIWEIGLGAELAQVAMGATPEQVKTQVIVTDAATGETLDVGRYSGLDKQ